MDQHRTNFRESSRKKKGVARGIKRSCEETTALKEDQSRAAAVAKDFGIGQIATKLHEEILSYLEVTQEKAASRVCVLWRAILAIPKRREIIVNLALHNYDCVITQNALLSAIRERTTGIHLQYVAVTGKKDRIVTGPDYVRQVISTLKSILHVAGMKIALILSNIVLLDTDLMQEACRCLLAQNISAVCRRLILKHVSVVHVFGCLDAVWPFDTRRPDIVRYQNVQIPYATLDVNPESNVIDIIEQAVDHYGWTRYPDTIDLIYVAKWIRFVDRNFMERGAAKKDYDGYEASDTDKTKILTILKHWQNDDVRLRPIFSWEKVRTAHLDRNLLSLRKATLVALIYCVKRSQFYKYHKKKYMYF